MDDYGGIIEIDRQDLQQDQDKEKQKRSASSRTSGASQRAFLLFLLYLEAWYLVSSGWS